MKWQHFLFGFFGVLFILWGYVQTKEKDTPVLIFILWVLMGVWLTGALIRDFNRKRKQKEAKDEES